MKVLYFLFTTKCFLLTFIIMLCLGNILGQKAGSGWVGMTGAGVLSVCICGILTHRKDLQDDFEEIFRFPPDPKNEASRTDVKDILKSCKDGDPDVYQDFVELAEANGYTFTEPDDPDSNSSCFCNHKGTTSYDDRNVGLCEKCGALDLPPGLND